ncbi:5-deoxy-glucuronate isomerase [Veronia pacifica]|uniref:5-deoxy-glucuronate isomerase n=1 Tax=Veronia pacifica TaxID=1080227 RepID=A0A1C3EMR5_9GAMM|nr:5-deoxy-glucuronate isomerase [Veronia pacifica]ODA34521.1 5-deoxy-glucuronate isomerase [Veronia pacifica]
MSELLSKRKSVNADGCIQNITPESAGWSYVGFQVYYLDKGQQLSFHDTDNELCLVLVSGLADIALNNLATQSMGERMDPFERLPPWSLYLTVNDSVTLTAKTCLELAVCRAPGKGTYPSRIITPEQVGSEARGQGNNKRFVHNILPDSKDADSLLVVEVYTDEGCTSSYPSHKHDRDTPPDETLLEETYYHRLRPEKGFCFQRVYTDDRDLDECMAVYDGDVVMVPRGYHPVATIAGYDSYYLNVMAGPVRKWLFSWEDDHQWVNTDAYRQKLSKSAK